MRVPTFREFSFSLRPLLQGDVANQAMGRTPHLRFKKPLAQSADQLEQLPPHPVHAPVQLGGGSTITAPAEILKTAPKLEALDWVSEDIPDDHFANTLILLAYHGFETVEALIAKLIEKGADPSLIVWAPVPYSYDPETVRRVAQYGVHIVQPAGAGVQWPDGIPTPHLTHEQQALRKRIHHLTQPLRETPHQDCYRLGQYREAREHQLRRMLQSISTLWRAGLEMVIGDDAGLLNTLLHKDSALVTAPEDFALTPYRISTEASSVAHVPIPHEVLKKTASSELTKRGITELNRLPSLEIPTVDIATSEPKELERGIIAEAVLSALLEMMPDAGFDAYEGKSLVIAGYGWVGSAVATLAAAIGFNVTVYDEDEEVRAALQARRDPRIRVATNLLDAAKKADVLLGCTGRCPMTAEILQAVPEDCLVASGSSGEVEIDVGFLEQRKTGITARQPIHELSRVEKDDGRLEAILDTQVEGVRQHFLDGKRFYLASGGRPINMIIGKENIEAKKIQLTRALQFRSLAQAKTLVGKPPQVVPLDERINEVLVPRIKALWKTLPQWQPVFGKRIHQVKQQRWKDFEADFKRKLPGEEFRDLSGASDACPVRFPRAWGDQGHWCRLFQAPDGTLMFYRQGGGMTLPLPIKDEEPIHVELMHYHNESYRFGLVTKTKDGERMFRTMWVKGRGNFMPYETIPDGHEIHITSEIKNAHIASWHVAPFMKTKEGRIVEPGVDIWPRAFGTDRHEQKKIILRHEEGMLEADADGDVKVVTDEQGLAFHNRIVLNDPPRLRVQLGETNNTVTFKADAKIVDVRSHFNLDLVVLQRSDGQQAVVAVEWPVDLMPHGWPRGDAPSPDDDPVRRALSMPKEPHTKLWIGPSAQSEYDRHTVGAGIGRLGVMPIHRMTDINGDPTVEVSLLPGAAHALNMGFPHRLRGAGLVSVGSLVDQQGKTVMEMASYRALFDRVEEMDPRFKPTKELRVGDHGGLGNGRRFRDAQYDVERQLWRIQVDTLNEHEEVMREVLIHKTRHWHVPRDTSAKGLTDDVTKPDEE